MKATEASTDAILGLNHRLDAAPYAAGFVALRDRLRKLPTARLDTLVAGHLGGIYTPPIHNFKRTFVQSRAHGYPFIGTTSMLRPEFTGVRLLSRRDAESQKLAPLELRSGMTLVSCSGTIGRVVYTRPKMQGMWSSGDILKIHPDPRCIQSGYLFAFLSSSYGVPLLTSGTYGSIIRHIERDHVAGLPVPRFEPAFENKVHTLVEAAAALIDRYAETCDRATVMLLREARLEQPSDEDWHASEERLGWANDAVGSETLRPLNFDPRARSLWVRVEEGLHERLGALCEPKSFKGKTIFKRVDADPEYGVLLVGQRQAFQMNPDGRWLATASIRGLGLTVPPGTTLIPSHGTLGEYELYSQAVIVTPRTSAYAFSGDFFRCVPKKGAIAAGYLFAFLRSRMAFRMLRSISSGGKQQEPHPRLMWRFPIPRVRTEVETEVASLVDDACDALDQGVRLEDEARHLVEQAIGLAT